MSLKQQYVLKLGYRPRKHKIWHVFHSVMRDGKNLSLEYDEIVRELSTYWLVFSATGKPDLSKEWHVRERSSLRQDVIEVVPVEEILTKWPEFWDFQRAFNGLSFDTAQWWKNLEGWFIVPLGNKAEKLIDFMTEMDQEQFVDSWNYHITPTYLLRRGDLLFTIIHCSGTPQFRSWLGVRSTSTLRFNHKRGILGHTMLKVDEVASVIRNKRTRELFIACFH